MEIGNARYYEFGEFRLDKKRRNLLKNGERISLSGRVFDLLLVLVENEGQILDHDALLDKVWGETFVEQSNLKKAVSALRHVLGEQPNESLYVKTIPRRGYSFVAPVRALPDEIESSVEHETKAEIIDREIVEEREKPEIAEIANTLPPGELKVVSAKPKKHWIAVAASVLLILPISFFVWRHFNKKPTYNYSVENVRAKRLTSEGNLGNSAPISPDGNYIVYPVYFGEQGSLWLRQVETGSVARLTPVMPASFWAYEFSPDGNYVYYILNHTGNPAESGLFRIPTLGGNPQRLIDRANGGLSFAPDGSRFALTRITEDRKGTEVVSAKPDGSDLQRAFLVPENKNLWSLKWSPDSLNLLYSVRERAENKLYGYVAETRWDNNSDTPAENIIFPKQEQAVINAVWLPDKTGLLLSLRELNADICQLWQYNPVNGEKRRITNDDNSYRIISLTRDGRSLSTVQENWKSEIWAADNTTLDFHPLVGTKNSNITFWTKDGKLIYEGYENQQAAVWQTDPEGNSKRRLTQGTDGIYLYPSLSQNGDFITFVSNRSGANQIWRMNVDGSNRQKLTDSKSTVSLRSKILSDGQTLLFMELTNQVGWRLKKQTADGSITDLTKTDTDLWSLSPDEKSIAVIVKDDQTKKYKVQIQSLETGDIRKTFDFNVTRQLSWTRDGKALVYISTKDNADELILQPLDGTPPKVLSNSRGERISAFDWTFDSSKLLIVRSKFTADAFLIRSQGN